MPPSTGLAQLLPGDVVAVRTPPSAFGWLIRLGAALRGRPHQVDHVAIVHHIDAAGTTWLIEGRPGGVGWADAREYDNRWLLSNSGQAKTDAQRQQICNLAEQLLGTPYDWSAIMQDAMDDIGADRLWRTRDFGARPPAHVVCSSLAVWIYRYVRLAAPAGPERWCQPSDWAAWMLACGWL